MDFSKVKYIKCSFGVRWWEDTRVNGVYEDADVVSVKIPCVEVCENKYYKTTDHYWCPIIDVESGVIINWKKGVTADTHYKVCDDGFYVLCDKDMNPIKEVYSYVPSILDPSRESFGDYVIFNIDENGKIDHWSTPDESEYQNFIDNSFE